MEPETSWDRIDRKLDKMVTKDEWLAGSAVCIFLILGGIALALILT